MFLKSILDIICNQIDPHEGSLSLHFMKYLGIKKFFERDAGSLIKAENILTNLKDIDYTMINLIMDPVLNKLKDLRR